MAQRAILIFNLLLLISISAIEGERNINHRLLRSGNLQVLQPVNFLGNYESRDEPINYLGDNGQKRIRKRKPRRTGTKAFGQWDSSEYYDYDYESDETDDGNDQTDILFEIGKRSLAKPDPEIIPTAEKRNFYRGSRYQPKNYRRPSRKRRRRRPSK